MSSIAYDIFLVVVLGVRQKHQGPSGRAWAFVVSSSIRFLLLPRLGSHEISHLVMQGLHLRLQLRSFSQLIRCQYAANF